MNTTSKETRKAIWKTGCSGAFFYTLNREFGQPRILEEQASASLSGGLMQAGHQCGMLWGSTMAASAEAYRRYGDPDKAMEMALNSARGLIESYSGRAGCFNCREFTRTDFSRPLSLVTYMLFRARACFRMAGKWAPEALEAAERSLNGKDQDVIPGTAIPGKSTKAPRASASTHNCAVLVARRKGSGEEEAQMVAGFAGGMGLSGNGCGALGAALFVNSLELVRDNEGKNPFGDPRAKNTVKRFAGHTGQEFLCHKICGRKFSSPGGHSEFIKGGGCKELIDVLVRT